MEDVRTIIVERAPSLTIALGILIIAVFLPKLFSGNILTNFPSLDQHYGNAAKREKNFVENAQELYRQGYQKFKTSIFRLTTTNGEHLVLPTKYLDELRKRPDSEINILKALEESLESKHTGFNVNSPLLNHIVRADLTPGLARINPRLSEEVERTLRLDFPECKDWTAINFYSKLLRIVAIVSGHIFLGPELCRNEDYIYASIHFTVDYFSGVTALKKLNHLTRYFGRFIVPEVKRLDSHRAKAKAFLGPVIKQRQEAMKNGEELPDDVLQFMLNKAEQFDVNSVDDIAIMQLSLSMAAIHTTTATVTNLFYDLAVRPNLVNELREEIRQVTKEYDGVLTSKALYDMKLLDSVIKESMRINSLGFSRFNRFVDKPITLSDGTQLPANVMIEVPHEAITRDPSLFPNPEEFDAYRYYNLRQAGGESLNRHQAVTVSETSLHFGYGRHACPGRFFAINEIKLIASNMLLKFDFKNKDGSMKRYENITVAAQQNPDPTKELLFKRVEA